MISDWRGLLGKSNKLFSSNWASQADSILIIVNIICRRETDRWTPSGQRLRFSRSLSPSSKASARGTRTRRQTAFFDWTNKPTAPPPCDRANRGRQRNCRIDPPPSEPPFPPVAADFAPSGHGLFLLRPRLVRVSLPRQKKHCPPFGSDGIRPPRLCSAADVAVARVRLDDRGCSAAV